MTPKDFDIAINAFNERIMVQNKLEEAHVKQLEYQSWLTGFYVLQAIGSAFGGKHAKSYPDKPLTDDSDSIEAIAERNGKTEEEINQELLYTSLLVAQANARLEGGNTAEEG